MNWDELGFWGHLILARTSARPYQPPTDIYETEEEFVILVAVSRASEIKVTYSGGTIVVSGVRREPEPDVPKRYHLMEIYTGPFERRIAISASVDPEGIRSTYKDGLLEIRIPKRKPIDVEIE